MQHLRCQVEEEKTNDRVSKATQKKIKTIRKLVNTDYLATSSTLPEEDSFNLGSLIVRANLVLG